MSAPPGKSSTKLDTIDLVFGLIPYGLAFLGITAWTPWLIRALRGERAKISTRMSVIAGGTIASWSFASASRVRESLALRDSVIELREVARDAAHDETARDKRHAKRDSRIYKTTLAMAVLAALTLLVAIASWLR